MLPLRQAFFSSLSISSKWSLRATRSFSVASSTMTHKDSFPSPCDKASFSSRALFDLVEIPEEEETVSFLRFFPEPRRLRMVVPPRTSHSSPDCPNFTSISFCRKMMLRAIALRRDPLLFSTLGIGTEGEGAAQAEGGATARAGGGETARAGPNKAAHAAICSA
jgi:hypothetical protein